MIFILSFWSKTPNNNDAKENNKMVKKIMFFGIEFSIISHKIICDGLNCEKVNTNKYKERIILYIFKIYEEYQNKMKKSNEINIYILINYRKKY